MRSDVVKFKTLDGSTVYDSVTDWGMTLTHCDEQKPAPKFERIDVPGANGSVDVSTALSGDIPFEDREVELTFFRLCADHDEAYALAGEVASAVHGKQMQLPTPDARADGNTWYTGDVEITECRFEDRGCEVDVRAVCSPFRLSAANGSHTVEPGASAYDFSPTVLATIPSAYNYPARTLDACYQISHTYSSSWSASGVAFEFARTSNLFDLGLCYMVGKTIAVNGTNWVNSSVISQENQRAAFNNVSSGWVERIVINPANVSPRPYPGIVFPFSEQTRCKMFFFSGEVTANVGSVTADGRTFAAEASVHTVTAASGQSVTSSGVLDGGSFATVGSVAAPAVGGSWDGDSVDFAVNPYTTQLYIDLAGITATDVYVLVMFYDSTSSEPSAWVEPDVAIVPVQVPNGFDSKWDGTEGTSVTGTVRITPGAVRAVTADAVVSELAYPSGQLYDAKRIAAHAINSSGQLVRYWLPVEVFGYWLSLDTFTFDAGDMPGYPTFTSASGDGTTVEINGNMYILPSSTTVELDTILARGQNTATVSRSLSGNGVLTWPKGVL